MVWSLLWLSDFFSAIDSWVRSLIKFAHLLFFSNRSFDWANISRSITANPVVVAYSKRSLSIPISERKRILFLFFYVLTQQNANGGGRTARDDGVDIPWHGKQSSQCRQSRDDSSPLFLASRPHWNSWASTKSPIVCSTCSPPGWSANRSRAQRASPALQRSKRSASFAIFTRNNAPFRTWVRSTILRSAWILTSSARTTRRTLRSMREKASECGSCAWWATWILRSAFERYCLDAARANAWQRQTVCLRR